MHTRIHFKWQAFLKQRRMPFSSFFLPGLQCLFRWRFWRLRDILRDEGYCGSCDGRHRHRHCEPDRPGEETRLRLWNKLNNELRHSKLLKNTILNTGPETLVNRWISTRAFQRWCKYLGATKSNRFGESIFFARVLVHLLSPTLSANVSGETQPF